MGSNFTNNKLYLVNLHLKNKNKQLTKIPQKISKNIAEYDY